ncbi:MULTISPECIES: rod shape-determining protein RodA [Oleiagrimonas]|uniref:Peptidoglycan glycosyltransferase MrdB n=1 Tax=Oleiagrimonas citrea TaxID=1665687 RepID=A0A846ZMS3_9GAMM|nr:MULTISPECIES: rod shape-determining protein RodA [Oleiagrimonas]NKZ39286.1 rod shape-determining protein RodA [Oleiagrimonas citrea]RAP59732.1 rod shape-determining protein RodA [Oleiagrimonas sp. MCCC 1A03011]
MMNALGMRLRRFAVRLWEHKRLDWPLMGGLSVLACAGLITLYSAGDENVRLVINQALRFLLGGLLLLLISRISPRDLRTWTPWLYSFSVLLLVIVAIVGEGRGAYRWLDLGVVRFQPSELLKLTTPMMVAWYLHPRHLPPSWKHTLGAAVLIGIPVGLIAEQPDLGTALLVAAAGAFVLFLSGMGWKRILSLLGLAVLAAPVAWHFMHDYQRQRVLTMLNPESDPLGAGWHIIQSKIAVGSGGFFGKGWQHGTQSHLEFLPEHTTDFVFAVFGEEFGLFGVLLLLTLYLFIVGRSLWIAAEARETYSRLLAGSIALSFFVYVVVNGGMITGLLPVVGVPLPLISYGGTSAVSLLAGFGVLMSIHAHRKMLK